MKPNQISAIILTTAVGALTACDRAGPMPSSPPASATLGTPGAPATGPIKIVADENGYTPSTVTIAKGSPATLEFVRTSDKTCATEVVLPDLNVNKPLPLNTPVDISVPARDAKTYAFACGMGMHKRKRYVKGN